MGIFVGNKELDTFFGNNSKFKLCVEDKVGTFYAFGSNRPETVIIDAYEKGTVLYNKEITASTFTETVELKAGYFDVICIDKGSDGAVAEYSGYAGGTGSSGTFYGNVWLEAGTYTIKKTSTAVSIINSENEVLIESSCGSKGERPGGFSKLSYGVQGSGGRVNYTLDINRIYAIGKLGGLTYTYKPVYGIGHFKYPELNNVGLGGEGHLKSTAATGESGLVKITYTGKLSDFNVDDLVIAGMGNSNSENTYKVNVKDGIYKFTGIGQGAAGSKSTSTSAGSAGNSGYYFSAYLRLNGEYKITVNQNVIFKTMDEQVIFQLNDGSNPKFTSTASLFDLILQKEIKKGYISASGSYVSSANIRILERLCGNGESGSSREKEAYSQYNENCHSGFELIYCGDSIPE